MMIAIDPGYTTGTVIADNIISAERFNVVGAFDVSWNKRFEFFSTFLRTHAAQLGAIVCEEYKLSTRPEAQQSQAGSKMPSSRVIGLIECLCYDLGIYNRLIMQPPKYYHYLSILPEHQRIVGDVIHNQVAYRHLRYYLRMLDSEKKIR